MVKISGLWPAWLVLAVPTLLPFARLSELPILILFVLGIRAAFVHRDALRASPAWSLYLLAFGCYWIPGLLSATDAVSAERSWTWVLAQLRFLPAGAFVILCLDARQQRVVLLGSATLVLAWSVDALVQAALGYNLLAMPRSPERLNGIFGMTNIKLGPMLAVLAALALEPARRAHRPWIFGAAFASLTLAILLVGTRAAWIMFLVVVLGLAVPYVVQRPRRGLLALVLMAVAVASAGVIGYRVSEGFAERVDRSLLALGGDAEALDTALSYRLPIWEAAVEMAGDHWFNGVGVRGFRYVYADYAGPDDRWLTQGEVATHAHQIVLEALTETGVIGLLGWLLGAALAWRAWRRADPSLQGAARPWGLCLLAAVFPLNTHLAFYSTFWSVVFWWLLMNFCAALRQHRCPGEGSA